MTSVRDIAPYKQETVGRDGFLQLLRAEFTKFRTVRSWIITLAVTALLMVAFAFVGGQAHSGTCIINSNSPSTCTANSLPRVPLGPGGEPIVDTFSYQHQSLMGNGSLTAKVSSLTEITDSGNVGGTGPGRVQRTTVPWAKAGILIEESTAQGSTYAAVMVTPGHGVRLQYNYVHDTAGLPGAVSISSPRWLRLTRNGDVITGYDSLDGNHWLKIGTVYLGNLAKSVQAGLFVTSPADGLGTNDSSTTVATAIMEQTHLSGDLPNSGWKTQVVGADTENYPARSGRLMWFRQSAGAYTIKGSGDIAAQVGDGTLGLGETTGLLASGVVGLIPVIVLATLFITSEYRRRIISTTFTACPRRYRVLAAKAVVIGLVTFIVACLTTGIAETILRHVLTGNGDYVFPLSVTTAIRVTVGTGLVFAIAAVLVLALGTILRRSAGAIVTGTLVFVLPFILGAKPSSSTATLMLRFTPIAAFAVQGTLPRYADVSNSYTWQNGYYPLGPWFGLAILGGFAAIAYGVALWSIRRRDV